MTVGGRLEEEVVLAGVALVYSDILPLGECHPVARTLAPHPCPRHGGAQTLDENAVARAIDKVGTHLVTVDIFCGTPVKHVAPFSVGWRCHQLGLVGSEGVGGAAYEEAVEGHQVDIAFLGAMLYLELVGPSERRGESAFETGPVADFPRIRPTAVNEQGAGVACGVDRPHPEFLLEHTIARGEGPYADVVLHPALQGHIGREGMGIAWGIVVAGRHIAFAVDGTDIQNLGSCTHQAGSVGDGPRAALLEGVEKEGFGRSGSTLGGLLLCCTRRHGGGQEAGIGQVAL